MQNLILQHKNLCTTVTSDQSTVPAMLVKFDSTTGTIFGSRQRPARRAKVILSTHSAGRTWVVQTGIYIGIPIIAEGSPKFLQS